MFAIKTLIIAEKPSVARDIAAVLGSFKKMEGHLENQEYLVSWAFGHLLELAEPHEYDESLTKWNLGQLPIIPPDFRLKPVREGRKQLQVLRNLLNSSEVGEVINACDAGREGELIFRRIYRHCGCQKPIKRLWLSEATPSAIKSAFQRLLAGKEMDNLAAAAEARAEADWLVGINATRAFSVRHNSVLSVGRVQTPTLALVVTREREIRDFKPAKYWEIWAVFRKETGETYPGKWVGDNNGRLFSRKELDAILEKIKGTGTGRITGVDQKESVEQPPTLFNLNDLQKEANRRYGLTAQQTLNAAQELYEKYKLLTYPRTDSRYITQAMVSTLQGRLNALSEVPEYKDLIPKGQCQLGKRYVNDGKVTDHHAIIPTDKKPDISALGKNEQLVYDLVARRFLAVFYPDARYAVTKVITTVNGESFTSKGKVELDRGWKAVYRNESEQEKEDDGREEQAIPHLAENETVTVQKVETPEKQTKPPKRYTEATLLAAMENAGKMVKDKEMADTLKAAGGIGTPATRAAIIERLIKVGYIQRQKKTLVPTPKGEALIDLVPEQVKSVEMTAEWEEGLRQIEEGQNDAGTWLENIKNFAREVVQIAKEQEASNAVGQDREILGKCPLCGKDVIEGKKGYGCSGYREGCKFVIWKEIAGKKITAKQAKDLLEKGKTGVIKGFKSKAGKKFDAVLKLSGEGKVEFDFPQRNIEPLGKCPLCGKNVVEGKKGYGCSGYKEGCKFVIWKEIAGKKITAKQAKDLLKKGKTGIIKGFKSKAGKKFDAALVMENGKVGFEFDRG
ncbi:DNA topoisomerase-3 [Desulfohalotomaculum tongense]|uniref:DNA topoisomerase 3 n=1 Tax=Desulforadius tongensis TaxID=1216062 RepID=UPI00308409D3|nr:DNA topoisomerase-3 [Desulforadius tongensis]